MSSLVHYEEMACIFGSDSTFKYSLVIASVFSIFNLLSSLQFDHTSTDRFDLSSLFAYKKLNDIRDVH